MEREADLWDLRDRLDAAGFWVSEVVDHGFIHSLYSFDPNNIPVEFSTRSPGVDLSAHPVMADTKPTACAAEGSEPVHGVWPAPQRPTPQAERRAYPGEGLRLVGQEPDETDGAAHHV